jgi:hypothetical protein
LSCFLVRTFADVPAFLSRIGRHHSPCRCLGRATVVSFPPSLILQPMVATWPPISVYCAGSDSRILIRSSRICRSSRPLAVSNRRIRPTNVRSVVSRPSSWYSRPPCDFWIGEGIACPIETAAFPRWSTPRKTQWCFAKGSDDICHEGGESGREATGGRLMPRSSNS